MTIYIYGSKSFKNNIHEVLERANMKFRLSDDDSIQELDSLDELKEAIEENPKDIFLIDDDKIIKKNALNNKIKFLKPKNGIEEEFLKSHGIGELSVDDIEDIATEIIRKLKEVHSQKEASKQNVFEDLSVEESSKNSEFEFVHGQQNKEERSVKNSKKEPFVSEEEEDSDVFLYDKQEKNEEIADESDSEDDEEFNIDDVLDFGEEDENNDKMEDSSAEENEDDDAMFDVFRNEFHEDDEIEEKRLTPAIEEEDKLEAAEETKQAEEAEEKMQDRVEDKSNPEAKPPLQKDNFEATIEKIEQKKGERDMSDEFSELDSLNENELLEALTGANVSSNTAVKSQESPKKSSAEVELTSTNINDISSLIAQLLNNKTLEITIKIRE